MNPASTARQRPPDARLLVLADDGSLADVPRARLPRCLARGDLVVVNDAATLPASLAGVHARTGAPIEVRLAAWHPGCPGDPRRFVAVVFGAGDFRLRTEDRPLPPVIAAGDVLTLGPLNARVSFVLGHPRLVTLEFEGSVADAWRDLARHGRPIQYSYLRAPLALFDVWTPMAGPPAAFESPSASFVLDWQTRDALHNRGVRVASITHAAGLSSTGDSALDARLPLPEAYAIPHSTAAAIRHTKERGGRVVAVGTTVVRALEHATHAGHVRAGRGMADQRIGAGTRLSTVDALVSGAHEPGSSHYELLRAFASDVALAEMSAELETRGYRSHEFGDSVLIARQRRSSHVLAAGQCHCAALAT